MLSLPDTAQIRPLTQTAFFDLLSKSQTSGSLKMHCCAYARHATTFGKNTTHADDDESNMGAFMDSWFNGLSFAFEPMDPRTAWDYGPYFNVLFYHTEIANFIVSFIKEVQDIHLDLELVPTDGKITVTITSNNYPALYGKTTTVSFSADSEQPIVWAKPVHDEDFVGRITPVLYQKIFGDEASYWTIAGSICPGVCLFAKLMSKQQLVVVVDLDQFTPIESTHVLLIPEARAAMFSVDIDGCVSATRLFDGGDEALLQDVKRIAQQFNLVLPEHLEYRWFLWQRYITRK